MNIIKAFEKSMAEYDAIQKSNHWKKFDSRKELYKEENLENFRNNNLSEGLDDRFDSEKQREIFEDLVTSLGNEYVLSNLSGKNVGNSQHFFKIGDLFVDGGQNFHIKWLHDLEMFVFPKKKINYICEIGGGYGSFAQKIRSKINCKYILIDLPEANILSSYYLATHFPDLKFLLCDGIENKFITKKDVDKYDFVIIPPWYEIRDVKFDLFINTRSMMEMNIKVIRKYFDFIHKNIADEGFFLNVNRYYKASVGYPIELSEYPYDENWNVLLSTPSWRQDHIHELITQRQRSKGNIKDELSRIDALYKSMSVQKNLSHYGKVYQTVKNIFNRFRYQHSKKIF